MKGQASTYVLDVSVRNAEDAEWQENRTYGPYADYNAACEKRDELKRILDATIDIPDTVFVTISPRVVFSDPAVQIEGFVAQSITDVLYKDPTP